MKVHPLADFFPMLPEDELQSLADAIKLNGLREPIIVDADKQLIDGRNRLEACKRAGVAPTFEQLGDRDPVSLILEKNVVRRHLSKGQCAMAFAYAHPQEPSKGGRGNKNSVFNTEFFSRELLQKARFVQRHAPDLVAQVMAGGSLNEAYGIAETRKQEIELIEQRIKERKLTMETIGTSVPLVVQADLSAIDVSGAPRGFPHLPSRDAIEAQQELLRELMDVTHRLEKVATAEALPPLADHVEFVNAIRAGARNITAHVNRLADNYNKTLTQSLIKRVK